MITLKQAEETRTQLIEEHRRIISALDVLIIALQGRQLVSDVRSESAAVMFGPPVPPAPSLENPPDWPADPRQSSLRDYLSSLIRWERVRDWAWTSRTAWDALNARGVMLAGGDVNAQVNNVNAVMMLLSTGHNALLVQTIKGKGRRASQFKIRTPDTIREAELNKELLGDGEDD